MRNLVKWIVWYTEGRCFTGTTQQEWDALPQTGCLWLQLQYDDGGVINFNGQDIFFCVDNIHGSDNDRDGLLRRLPWIKWGQWVTDQEFQEIDRQARLVSKEHREHFISPN